MNRVICVVLISFFCLLHDSVARETTYPVIDLKPFGLEVKHMDIFKDGRARIIVKSRDGEKYGYINERGAIEIFPDYDFAGPFSDGLAEACRGKSVRFSPGRKCGYIDKNGVVAIDFRYSITQKFSEGLAFVAEDGDLDKRWQGFIDKSGRKILRIGNNFRPLDPDAGFFDGLALFSMFAGEGYLAIDKLGVTKLRWDKKNMYFSGGFHEGLAAFTLGFRDTKPKYGYMDKSGMVRIEPVFDFASEFSDGLAFVHIDKRYFVIDSTGKTILDPNAEIAWYGEGLFSIQHNNLPNGYGYIDSKGNVIISPRFAWAGPFSEGRAAVKVQDGGDVYWRYIDKSGKILLEIR